LALLQQIQCEGRDVLDVGTGSGILAIAAARLGASHVCAIDRDGDALLAAADGVHRNAVKKVVELKHADISVDALGRFDVVIANLEAPQIAGCASSLLACVRADGSLLLSGFLAAELPIVTAAFSEPPARVEYEDGWAATVFARSAQ
jgi:ribosomal protein L11 methyltransferase